MSCSIFTSRPKKSEFTVNSVVKEISNVLLSGSKVQMIQIVLLNVFVRFEIRVLNENSLLFHFKWWEQENTYGVF